MICNICGIELNDYNRQPRFFRCKSCHSNKLKEFREANKNNPDFIERQRKYKKKYYETHKEQCNKASIEWKKKNPDKAKEIRNRTQIKNADKIRATVKKYYHEHKEEIKKKVTEYRKLHPEKVKQYAHNTYLRNPEAAKKRMREWELKNPERAKINRAKAAKNRRLNHPDKVKKCYTNWLERNPEYHRKYKKENLQYKQHQKEYSIRYKKEHKEQVKKWHRNWCKLHKDKRAESNRKTRAKKPEHYRLIRKKHKDMRAREMGCIPLNSPFNESHGHHIDKEHVIYIPKSLHLQYLGKHNHKIPETMIEINKKAFFYLMNEMIS